MSEMIKSPKVSVCVITYNHAKYITEALEGVLKQQCNFEIEIIIGDDASKDGTQEIIREYACRYPELINASLRKFNVGMHRNWEESIRRCNGKYIALLEGDDLWIDPNKLQKQVEILERETTIAVSFTNAKVINNISNMHYPMYVTRTQEYYELHEILQANFIPTCTAVFRNHLFSTFPKLYYKSPYADWVLHLLNGLQGKFHFLNELTACYRLHSEGVFGSSNNKLRLERKLTTYQLFLRMLNQPNLRAQIFKHKRDLRYQLRQLYWRDKQYLKLLSTFYA